VTSLLDPIVSSEAPDLLVVGNFNLDYSKLIPRDPIADEKAFIEINNECIEHYVRCTLAGQTPKAPRDTALHASSRVKEAKNMKKLGNEKNDASNNSFIVSSSGSKGKPVFQLDIGLEF
jgi:hypothetical protein